MAHDLRTTLSPVYPDLLTRLLKLLPRSITAPALGILLETLSTLFKFLLVPSIHLDLLERTWIAVREILPTCLPEVQRAMAEVWGSVLRRLKTAARDKAVTLLAEKAEGVEDASAWVIVFACKVRHTNLHTHLILIHCHSVRLPDPTYSHHFDHGTAIDRALSKQRSRADIHAHPARPDLPDPPRQKRGPILSSRGPTGPPIYHSLEGHRHGTSTPNARDTLSARHRPPGVAHDAFVAFLLLPCRFPN